MAVKLVYVYVASGTINPILIIQYLELWFIVFFFSGFWKAELEWGCDAVEGSPSPRKCFQGCASPAGLCWPWPGKLGTSVWASPLTCSLDKMEM